MDTKSHTQQTTYEESTIKQTTHSMTTLPIDTIKHKIHYQLIRLPFYSIGEYMEEEKMRTITRCGKTYQHPKEDLDGLEEAMELFIRRECVGKGYSRNILKYCFDRAIKHLVKTDSKEKVEDMQDQLDKVKETARKYRIERLENL